MSEANAEIKTKNKNNERKRVTKKGTGGSTFVVHPPPTRIRAKHPLARLVQNAGTLLPSLIPHCKGRHNFRDSKRNLQKKSDW